ncbi:MAG: hypothetical protein HY554_12930 [Elusimicrobia bacterium]|nr:hypothetical protein [Elusimicrobiota bacterium]
MASRLPALAAALFLAGSSAGPLASAATPVAPAARAGAAGPSGAVLAAAIVAEASRWRLPLPAGSRAQAWDSQAALAAAAGGAAAGTGLAEAEARRVLLAVAVKAPRALPAAFARLQRDTEAFDPAVADAQHALASLAVFYGDHAQERARLAERLAAAGPGLDDELSELFDGGRRAAPLAVERESRHARAGEWDAFLDAPGARALLRKLRVPAGARAPLAESLARAGLPVEAPRVSAPQARAVRRAVRLDIDRMLAEALRARDWEALLVRLRRHAALTHLFAPLQRLRFLALSEVLERYLSERAAGAPGFERWLRERYPALRDVVFDPEAAIRSLKGRRSLVELFGRGAIRSVFNGDAGKASWQREARRQPWLASDATVVGFELPVPLAYDAGRARVVPREDWAGVEVLTAQGDPRFPRAGSVDLVHAAFMELWHGDFESRLALYASLAREGGFLALSHSDAYATLNVDSLSRLSGAMLRRADEGWSLVAYFDGRDAPPDYPATDWWREFSKSVGDPRAQFLLVFRKGPARTPPGLPPALIGARPAAAAP